MTVSVTNQAQVFLISVVGGIALGLLFDLFRAFRRLVHSGAAWVAVQDICFWLLAAAMVFFCIYRYNSGQPRWYIFCGLAAGAALCRAVLGDGFVTILVAAVRIFLKIFRFLLKILLFPIVFLCRVLRKPLVILYIPARRFLLYLHKKLRLLRQMGVRNAKRLKKRLKMY